MEANIEVARATYRAIKQAGGAKKLGEALGINQHAVYAFRRRARVPEIHLLMVEAMSGVSRAELRPDLYGAINE